jgi:hypothetical protein
MRVRHKVTDVNCEAIKAPTLWFVISIETHGIKVFSEEEFHEQFSEIKDDSQEVKVESKRPTLEEMNARKCRNQSIEFKVLCWCDELSQWIGIVKVAEYDRWRIESWLENGAYFLNINGYDLDLIEQSREWSEEVDMALVETNSGVTTWKERRFYREENGVTKFIRSEVIE